ncbi:endonuclease/exonuclease/phosphatase family protein [Futiania mangrovi]|uniref:Endonuclease/exonuclease/phosphatase family protein n=1 Tax=Futiania mangrovi TaxID=2959716 RepID=A0A9J6PC33_9PROT|nr:endonuclease/exonuclease/phosphatase family protein [Futiania mangrovii]MCP1337756.1 endonuclease/exonuclease/phosphatase family protein [Futiania mangrovii]
MGAGTVRIATFNVENLGAKRAAGPPLGERIAALRPQIVRLDADILCLQEVNGTKPPGGGPRVLHALDAVLEGTAYEGFHRISTLSPSGSDHGVADVHNLVQLSRFPVEDWRQLHHGIVAPPRHRLVTADPPEAEPRPLRWERPALQAALSLPDGRRLHVLNLHLRAPLAAAVPGGREAPFAWARTDRWAEGYWMAAVQRAGQALEARLAVDRILDEDHDALVAVCGDLNAEMHEDAVRILCAGEEDTGNARLAARALIPLAREVAEERRFSVRHAGRPLLLDHILASRPLAAAVEAVEIHNHALGDELVGALSIHGGRESHHAPVVAAFRL